MCKHSISGRTRPTQLRRTEPDRHIFFLLGGYSEEWVPCRTSTRLLGSCMDMQEGVLLGVCRGCVCSREWIPRQVSLGGVDTLARIRVTATREKSKGNCTRPGMDVNS